MYYSNKRDNAALRFRDLSAKSGKVSLKQKSTSHIFRKRNKNTYLNLKEFNQVISVNEKRKTAEVEGLTTFSDLVKETLKVNLIPLVVPELRNITVGGAISGLGVESTSFKHGAFHESVVEMDVLTGNGNVITCNKDNNKDMFYSIPNSFGTLGYVLKCKIRLISVKKYAEVRILRFNNPTDYFSKLKTEAENKENSFLDGAIFSDNNFVIAKGRLKDFVPKVYKEQNFVKNIYYKYLKNTNSKLFYLNIGNYLWRWDHDVFWATSKKGIFTKIFHNKYFRNIFGKQVLRSDRLIRANIIAEKLRDSRIFLRNRDVKYETLKQDIGVEIDNCKDFFIWYKNNIDLYPVWICPIIKPKHDYTLYNWEGRYMVDMGFYSYIKVKNKEEPYYYNRLIEREILKLGGTKGLYSNSYFTKKEFWSMYDRDMYKKVKYKYDKRGVSPDLYDKAVE